MPYQLLTLLFAIVWSTSALAQADTFTVHDVTVELPGLQVSEKTRARALKQASLVGFDQLLKRMTARNIWHRHQNVIDQASLDRLVLGVSLRDEQQEGQTYVLTADVAFSPEEVRQLLKVNLIPFSETRGGTMVVFPVYQTAGSPQLWGENPWAEALLAQQGESTFFEVRFPVGTAAERAQVTSALAMVGAGDALLSVAGDYEADAAVVASVKVSADFLGSRYVEVEGRIFGNADEWPIYSRFAYPDDMSEQAMLTQAASLFYGRLGAQSQNDSVIDVSRRDRVYLRYRPADIAQSQRVIADISGLSTVKEFKTRVMHVHDMVFQVDFFGDRQRFQDQLTSRGFTIVPTSRDVVWGLIAP